MNARDPDEDDVEVLRAEVAALAEENDRLRAAYAAAHRTRYRHSALGLLAVGALAALAALLFPDARAVLLALAGIGGFAAVLTYYLTPERFVAASVGERLQHSTAETYATLIEELGLEDTRVYLPATDETDPLLFVPLHRDYTVPDHDARGDRFVVTDDDAHRGFTIVPSGAALLEAFEPALSGPLREEPDPLADQLGDGLVEQFELADRVDVDAEPGRITYEVADPALGPLTDVDHPVVSFLAVGTAAGLEEPVSVEVETGVDPPLVTCHWQPTTGTATDGTG